MRTSISFALLLLLLLPAPLLALDFSFSGQKPAALEGRTLTVATGVDVAEPVAFDFPDATTAVVRQAKDDEESTAAKPLYRLEWLSKDKSKARFFPVTPQAEVDRWRQLNDASLATAEGRNLENTIVMAYINKGKVVTKCMSGTDEMPEAITIFVTLTPGQSQANGLVYPESSVAECVLAATERGEYPAVKVPTTARMRIALTRGN